MGKYGRGAISGRLSALVARFVGLSSKTTFSYDRTTIFLSRYFK